jgi:hypothetical protein
VRGFPLGDGNLGGQRKGAGERGDGEPPVAAGRLRGILDQPG